MKRYPALIGIGLILLIVACATVEDIQRSSDLIRTDNELTRLLTDRRLHEQKGTSAFLMGLAADAREKAEALGHSPEAISYYRISATAYWRSDNPWAADKLFNAAEAGQKACEALGTKAPDRDCLFLKLVIPFAGLESASLEKNYDKKLENINWFDQIDTDKEVRTLEEAGTYLRRIKKPVESILQLGTDPMLLSHDEMKSYYCDNAEKANKLYKSIAANLYSKTKSYYEKQTIIGGSPEITESDAEKLRNLNIELPEVCTK